MTIGRWEHVGGAAATGLAAPMGPSDSSFTLTSGTGFPTGAGGKLFAIIVDPGLTSEEHIICSARSGTTVTVNSSGVGGRGADNTTASSHAVGTTNVQHALFAVEVDDDNDHVYTTTRDDHTQYARTDGTRAVTGTQSFVNTTNSGTLAVTGASTFTGTVSAGAITASASVTSAILASNGTGTSSRFVGRTVGSPATFDASGTFQAGDYAVDITNNVFWFCTVGGTPGTWVQIGAGTSDTAWTAISSFTNSWTNQGAPYYNAGYRQVDGKIYLRGVVKSGTVGSSMFTLPVGYRPASSVAFNPQSPNTGSGGLITIASTGTVIYSIGTGPLQVSLDGIVFDTLS